MMTEFFWEGEVFFDSQIFLGPHDFNDVESTDEIAESRHKNVLLRY